MFGKIYGFTGWEIAGFDSGSRIDSCGGLRNDSFAINSDGAIGLLPFTPSQVIGAVTIGCESKKIRVD